MGRGVGQCLVMIALSAPTRTIAIKYPQIVVGLQSGKVHFLEIQVKDEEPIITPVRLWLCGEEGKQGTWDDNIPHFVNGAENVLWQKRKYLIRLQG